MSRARTTENEPADRKVGGSPASMRLDKFLKVSRIIKRRSLANEACDTGHVTVNGKEAKPGTDVRPGDVLSIRFGERRTSYEILSVSEHAMKADAADMYRAIAE